MAAKQPIRRCKPIKGGREGLSAGVERKLRRAVEEAARTANCSKSLVVNVAVAKFLDINIEEDLYGE